ncbi:MAG: hypothetical protein NZ700_11260 [Gemmataceae bacterium]|nr:hypothetical protein [Gemmataceae bacterium]MDW8265329.1 hypothetical protein [Gemmataceae bacterium]
MSWYRSPLLCGVVAGAGLLCGAVWPQVFSPAASSGIGAGSGRPRRPDPHTAHLLDQARRAYDPHRVPWLKTDVWQRINLDDFAYQAEGTYLSGPDHRLRLDLAIRAGRVAGRVLAVSDGTTLWLWQRLGANEPTVQKLALADIVRLLNQPGTNATVRERFYHSHPFAGVAPLLDGLRRQLTWTDHEEVLFRGRPAIRLSGTWSQRPAEAWPEGLPHDCAIVLDRQTLWPHRIEWRDPAPEGERVVVELEFRAPVFNQRPAERLFAFQPGTALVADCTAAWAACLTAPWPPSRPRSPVPDILCPSN